MRLAVGRAIALLMALWAPPFAAAQDAHYWTYGYGPIGQLTEGTLVGGVSDLSAVFYNPGALALLDKPRFVVGLTSVELANIDVPGWPATAERRPARLRHRALDARGARRQPRGRQPLRVRVPVPPRLGLGPRLQRRQRLGARPDALCRLRPRAPAARRVLGRGHLVAPVLRAALGRGFAVRGLSRAAEPALVVARADLGRRVGAAFVGSDTSTTTRVLAKAGLAWRPGSWQLGMTVTAPGFG